MPPSPRSSRSCWACSLEGCLLIVIGITAAAVLVGGYRTVLDAQTPRITSIPLLVPGQTQVEISGKAFGARPGLVWLDTPGSGQQLADIDEWEPERIRVHLPAGVTSGSLSIQQKTSIGKRVSTWHDFLTRRIPSDPDSPIRAPTQNDSPWPTFRHDERNSGRSSILGEYAGGQPWFFQTGKGIFSTPVIDAQGRIYVGSADHYFYAVDPDGSLVWKYATGEIIDSAGPLFDAAPGSQEPGLAFISGDGHMYGFSLEEGISDPAERLLWKFEAEMRPGVSYNRWFEGNVAVGPDGTLYAGNTNFNYYAIHPNGELKWTYATDSNNWSQAAFGPDGTLYWGSNDTFIRAVSPSGKELWRRRTLGFIAASAAVGTDGTVYIGSFDSSLYALDPATGEVRWKFPTRDHIYSSAALGEDPSGETSAIYFGSADGSLYALKPDGSLLWRYDTGDPIRSSPVIGLVPGDTNALQVVYFGSSNGKLYALNAEDGSLRWSFDTTPQSDAELQDRNDLNGSPALSQTGITIGGEHGFLVHVPYDYCLQASDRRCSTTSSLPIRPSSSREIRRAGLDYVTPGGNTLAEFPDTLPAATLITLRLVVPGEDGQTQDAFVCNSPIGCPSSDLQVEFTPAVPFNLDHSADGRYIYIRPESFFSPGTDYQLSVKGRYYSGGVRLGNLTLFGRPREHFEALFKFRTPAAAAAQPPLQVSASQTSALEWTRLAAPLPPMLPSLNQIGFDYMDWILGTIAISPPDSQNRGKLLMWAVGAKRNASGQLVVDPETDFTLPLSGSYQNDSFILSNGDFKMAITGIDIPFNLLELRGQLGADGRVRPGATAFADTEALSIPTFGPYLVVAGLANNIYERLLVAGTYITRPYPPGDPANQAPPGVEVGELTFLPPTSKLDGQVTARFRLAPGAEYPLHEHLPGILLVDESTGEAVSLDYHGLLSARADPQGGLESVSLRLPAGLKLPAQVQAYVILDVFPLAQKRLGE